MSTESQPFPPREPSVYRPTVHFHERLKDKYDEYNRHIDGEIIEGCIRNGDAERVGPDIYHFRATFGGVTYRLVVNTDRSVVITGHPISINTEVARDSGRWSTDQIEDIREFIAAK
ncbi:hypothetical protein RBH26_20655 [Natronolimnohabitans sp. A-GB9]|uniref:hypothetical protein n=1 Tax=Natronolimnohabitans sp. A-GB9 TaxID=3069757 RepID=UPI0027B1A628|nr:hypothetical protein [Natronolimnohabitans sp. A-GB9]MDQ2052856.1 hypothetical protein [Natronolimnohabitans sp. A-GB9]